MSEISGHVIANISNGCFPGITRSSSICTCFRRLFILMLAIRNSFELATLLRGSKTLWFTFTCILGIQSFNEFVSVETSECLKLSDSTGLRKKLQSMLGFLLIDLHNTDFLSRFKNLISRVAKIAEPFALKCNLLLFSPDSSIIELIINKSESRLITLKF